MSKGRPRVPGTKVRPKPEHERVCLIVGDPDDPVVAVMYDDHRRHPHDSGYSAFTTSAPPNPHDATRDDFDFYCLACLREQHPEAKRGLLLAHAYGHAWWDDDEGEWIAEDDEGNEIVFEDGDDLPARPEDEEPFS